MCFVPEHRVLKFVFRLGFYTLKISEKEAVGNRGIGKQCEKNNLQGVGGRQQRIKPDKPKLQRKQVLTTMVTQQGNVLPKSAM